MFAPELCISVYWTEMGPNNSIFIINTRISKPNIFFIIRHTPVIMILSSRNHQFITAQMLLNILAVSFFYWVAAWEARQQEMNSLSDSQVYYQLSLFLYWLFTEINASHSHKG